jgi:competence protein ComEC
LVSPLANAFAIPTVSLLAVPLSLLAGVSPWPWPAEIAHAIIGLLMACLTWLDGLPQPVWHGAAPDIWALLLAGLGVLVLLLPRGVPGRWVGGLLFLPLIWPRLEHPAPGEFRLDVLDVGQGLSVLVRTH